MTRPRIDIEYCCRCGFLLRSARSESTRIWALPDKATTRGGQYDHPSVVQ